MNLQDIIKAHEEISSLIKSGYWDEVIGSKGCDLDAILAHDHRDFLINLVREMKPYVEFAEWVFKICVVEGCDIGGGDAQDELQARGFLIETIYDPEVHEGLVDASIVDPGDTVYFFNQALLDRLEKK